MQAPPSISTPTRSRTSRLSACRSVSPSSTLPPGNSHRSGSTAEGRRCVIRYRSSRAITAATTRTCATPAMAPDDNPHGMLNQPAMVKRVLPREAAALLADGWAYLDVRSIPEFEQGHPPGAVNVPLLHLQNGRMV